MRRWMLLLVLACAGIAQAGVPETPRFRLLGVGDGLPSSKVHSYLVSFTALDVVSQDPVTGHYGLGPFALKLGLGFLANDAPGRAAEAYASPRARRFLRNR